TVDAAVNQSLHVYGNFVIPALVGPPPAAEGVAAAPGLLPPDQRDPARVKRALEALAKEREALDRAALAFDECGTFLTPRVHQLHLKVKEYLTDCVRLCELAERALEAGDDWQNNFEALVHKAASVQRMLRRH